MLNICISLFAIGISFGIGPCLASCGPILISYIAATKRSPLQGLRSWFIFSISRVSVYVLLGAIAGIAGSQLFKFYYWEMPGYIIWLTGGVFICILGILIFLGNKSNIKICQYLNRSLIEKDAKSLITLGVLVGIFPCAPLIGVLSYITMISTHFSHGIILAAAFGLGTLVSPLVFFGILAGTIPKLKVFNDEKSLSIFQKICGALLAILGMHIIVKTIAEYIKAL